MTRLPADDQWLSSALSGLRKLDRDGINGQEYSEEFPFRFPTDGNEWTKLTITVKALIGTEASRKDLSVPGAVMDEDREAMFEAIVSALSLTKAQGVHTRASSESESERRHAVELVREVLKRDILPTYTRILGMVMTDFLRTIERYAPAVFGLLPNRSARHIRVVLGRPFGTDYTIQGYVKHRETYSGEPESDSLDHIRGQTGSFSMSEDGVWTLHIYTPAVLFMRPLSVGLLSWSSAVPRTEIEPVRYACPLLAPRRFWTGKNPSKRYAQLYSNEYGRGWSVLYGGTDRGLLTAASVDKTRSMAYYEKLSGTPRQRLDKASAAKLLNAARLVVRSAGGELDDSDIVTVAQNSKSDLVSIEEDITRLLVWLRVALHELTHELTAGWKKAPKVFSEGLDEYVLWKIGSARLDELRALPETVETKTADEALLDPDQRQRLFAIYANLVERATTSYTELQEYWKDWDLLYQDWFGMELLARGYDALKAFMPTPGDIAEGRVRVIRHARRILTLEGSIEMRETFSYVPLQSARYLFDEESSVVIRHAKNMEQAREKATGVQAVLRDAVSGFRDAVEAQVELLKEKTSMVHATIGRERGSGERLVVDAHDANMWAKNIEEMDTLRKLWVHVFKPLTTFTVALSEHGGNIGSIPPKELKVLGDLLRSMAVPLREMVLIQLNRIAASTIIGRPGDGLVRDNAKVNNYQRFIEPVERLASAEPGGDVIALLQAVLDGLSVRFLLPKHHDSVRNLQEAGKRAVGYIEMMEKWERRGAAAGDLPVFANDTIGKGQDALEYLGDATRGGFLNHESFDAYLEALAEATTLYTSRRTLDQQLADDLDKLQSVGGADWHGEILRFGSRLASIFRLTPPTQPLQAVVPASTSRGAFNFERTVKNFLSRGITPDGVMVTSFRPLLRNIHVALLVDLSWSMKGSSLPGFEAVGQLGIVSHDHRRALRVMSTVSRVSLAFSMMAATIAGVLKDAGSMMGVLFSETATSFPIRDVDDFLYQARFLTQKYVDQYRRYDIEMKYYRDKYLKGRRDLTADEKRRIATRHLSDWPEALKGIFAVEGYGARLDLALLELERTGFFSLKGTKFVFVFSDGSPERGDRNPLQDAPIQAEVVRQLTAHRTDAHFLFTFITPEKTEYDEVLSGRTMEWPANAPHKEPSLDTVLYTSTVKRGDLVETATSVHYATGPHYPTPPESRGLDAVRYWEGVKGLQPVRFRVMPTSDWVKRLERSGIATVVIDRFHPTDLVGSSDEDPHIDIVRAFDHYALGVNRLVREAATASGARA